ncbi:MAG TPA: alpha/beta fold hydrolase [bacterium]|nr:alpha/beta fold hydrolase [bacterium]
MAGWSLSGLRTWDCIRAVDYLVSRPEVDKDKLAVMGNSGGGQMALLTTAVDERISACAAGHPGGSMENTYLLGQRFIDRQVLSLIPPRPCRIIVGKDSGEEPGHRQKLEDMQLFYEGLAAGKQCGDLEVVQGVHDMRQPKRESAYEWLNKWLGKEIEGRAEQPLQPEDVETLWSTKSGITLLSLGGESGQTLNAKRAEQIYNPERDIAKLKNSVAKRIHFEVPQNHNVDLWKWRGTLTSDNFTVEKYLYESEKGIEIPSLLMRPKYPGSNRLVIIHASDKGKPTKMDVSSIPVEMVRKGYTILSIDVRGIGETDPSPQVTLNKYTGYISPQWRRDCLAINSASFKRTMLGMRALDVIRAIDFIKTRDELKEKRIILVGEGLGGLWTLLAAIYDSRPEAVMCVGTLASYRLILKNKYYNVWGYFWLPGALCDFDIPDLAGLVPPKRQLWIDPVNQLAERIDKVKSYSLIGEHEGLSIIATEKGSIEEVSEAISEFLR